MIKEKSAWIEPNGKGWERIAISFPYDKDTLAKIKTLAGRKYSPKNKRWFAPICPSTLNALAVWGFLFSPGLVLWRDKYRKNKVTASKNKKNIKGLLGTLRHFQKEGVNHIHLFGGRALLADEMGLGKTVQALAYLQHKKELRPMIIIVPASLKLNWRDEIRAWMEGADPVILYGRTPYEIDADIIIVNYDIVDAWKNKLKALNPQAIVLDECHYVRNAKANRSKAVRAIQKTAKSLIAISGTPIISKPLEFWNILNMIRPDLFNSWFHYVNTYCAPKKTPWGNGVDYSGCSNAGKLHKKLKEHLMIRRLKKNVLKELPPKIRTVIKLDCDVKNYNKAREAFMEWGKEYTYDKDDKKLYNRNNPARAMVEIGLIKKAAAMDKLEEAFKWVDDYLMNNDKLVIFAHHKDVVIKIMEHYKHIAVKIVGGMSPAMKNKAVDAFQRCANCGIRQDKHHSGACKKYIPDMKTRLLVGTKSAKEGLTLTAASATAFFEFWWDSTDHDQAEDRVHRIGQKSDTVVAYYLIADNTIEERIIEFIDNKRKITTSILDGVDVKSEELLLELLENIVD